MKTCKKCGKKTIMPFHTCAPRKEPTIGLLMSMAIRYDHALGMPGYYDNLPSALRRDGITHKQRLESTIGTMRQLWEEVSGNGFYSPDQEESYANTYRRSMEEKPNK